MNWDGLCPLLRAEDVVQAASGVDRHVGLRLIAACNDPVEATPGVRVVRPWPCPARLSFGALAAAAMEQSTADLVAAWSPSVRYLPGWLAQLASMIEKNPNRLYVPTTAYLVNAANRSFTVASLARGGRKPPYGFAAGLAGRRQVWPWLAQFAAAGDWEAALAYAAAAGRLTALTAWPRLAVETDDRYTAADDVVPPCLALSRLFEWIRRDIPLLGLAVGEWELFGCDGAVGVFEVKEGGGHGA